MTRRAGTACDPFSGNVSDELGRFDNPHAWLYAMAGRPGGRALWHQRAGNAARFIRASIAERRRVDRAILCDGRDVGAPHTWPIFGGAA